MFGFIVIKPKLRTIPTCLEGPEDIVLLSKRLFWKRKVKGYCGLSMEIHVSVLVINAIISNKSFLRVYHILREKL